MGCAPPVGLLVSVPVDGGDGGRRAALVLWRMCAASLVRVYRWAPHIPTLQFLVAPLFGRDGSATLLRFTGRQDVVLGVVVMITVPGGGLTLRQLGRVQLVTPPNAGSRWRGIRHADLVGVVRDSVEARGWGIERELYATARGGADMAGALLLRGVSDVQEVPGVRFALGILNSNSRRVALRLAVGASVVCCTNGVCTGDVLLSKVHDHTVDLVTAVGGALDQYASAVVRIPGMVGRLRETEVSPDRASAVLMEAGRRRLVGWATVGRVDREYRRPTFVEHGTGTSWALLNAFTYAARDNIAPTRQMHVYSAFLRMLPIAGSCLSGVKVGLHGVLVDTGASLSVGASIRETSGT